MTRNLYQRVDSLFFGQTWLAGWLWSRRVLREFRLNPPVTLNDKIRYKMAADRNPILTIFADKWAVREYVSSLVGPEVLTDVYAVVDKASNIPWDDLPDRYVLKATHGSGATIVVDDRASLDAQLPEVNQSMPWGVLARVHPSQLDREMAEQWATTWLRAKYWRTHGVTEWAYRNVPPRIIIEELIEDKAKALPTDYKFLCVHGQVQVVLATVDREIGIARSYRTRDWTVIKPPRDSSYEWAEADIPRPAALTELIRVAEALSNNVDFVRVDLYATADRVIFSEMTNYPAAGMEPLHSVPPLSEIGYEWMPHLNKWSYPIDWRNRVRK